MEEFRFLRGGGERPQSATQKWLNQSSWDWIGAMYVFPFWLWLSPVDHPALSHANEEEPKHVVDTIIRSSLKHVVLTRSSLSLSLS